MSAKLGGCGGTAEFTTAGLPGWDTSHHSAPGNTDWNNGAIPAPLSRVLLPTSPDFQ